MDISSQPPHFRDRRQAGRELGELLKLSGHGLHGSDSVVLALPRGGVPVAYEVAKALHAPLGVWIVRKLGVPGQEELAMGAISSGGVVVVNEGIFQQVSDRENALAAVLEKERRELARREAKYAAGQGPLSVLRRDVILVDDGLATGATMGAAVQALQKAGAGRIIVAVPVASVEAAHRIEQAACAFVCCGVPRQFWGVGSFYDDFAQTSDEEVLTLLEQRYQERLSEN